MRYYTIIISDPKTGKTLRTFTSFKNGQTDPGALNIELDIPVAPYATPFGAAFVRVWGISIQEIAQSSNYNFMFIKVYAGMQKGLPLANPKQSGLIVSGRIQQAFGNWLGVNLTLDLLITAGQATIDVPNNITLQWAANTPLASAIDVALKTAFPTLQRSINISEKLILAHDEPGFYGTLIQFAQYVKDVSAAILGGTYQGVDIVLKEDTFVVYDGTSQTSPLQIAFNDLIGQATWLASFQIQFNAVMRADLHINDYVKLPVGQVVTTQQSYSQYKQGSIFKGVFQIDAMRHVGNFRAPDGEAWITTVNCHVSSPASG